MVRLFFNKRLPIAIVLYLMVSFQSWGQAPVYTPQVESKARQILSQMTLEEKLAYVGGADAFYIRQIDRLGIKRLKMADGPTGVRNYGSSTAYPSGVNMASTWNPDLEKEVGVAMARDSRARGVHFLLAPGMNIYRAPMCGRNFEYFGEDPYLASRMAVAAIEGIQSQGVVATAKHFLGNNQEWDRHHVSSDIDERTLHEIYLPAFEASVKEAKVWAVMDSYNLVNGVHMTQNGAFNTKLLKEDWQFSGILMSDWDSTYDGVAAANGGLDLEMPAGTFMSPKTLGEALKDGRLTEAILDDKVLRILRTALAFGFFDREQTDKSIPLDAPEGKTTALKAAQESLILLKNNDSILPLKVVSIKHLAVLGPNADHAVTGGGGSSKVEPFHTTTPLQEIQKRFGAKVDVAYAPGMLLPASTFLSTKFHTDAKGGKPGFKAEFFNNASLKGEPALVRIDEHLNFDWGEGSYTPNGPIDEFSARWTGYYTPSSDGKYTVHISGDDGFRVYLDDKLLLEQWQYQGESIVNKPIELKAGTSYKFRVEYFEGTGQAKIGFGISADSEEELNKATAIAQKSDAVLLFLGFDSTTEGEGSDRPFDLPEAQVKLLQAVSKVNQNLIVVLNAGGGIHMQPWIEPVKGLLFAGYPGQEGSKAIVQALAGDINPSGKLPFSIERKWEDNATFNSYYDKSGSKHVAYTEGIFVGYRHFDHSGIQPLFPFGFGKTYTEFKYSKLAVQSLEKSEDGKVKVTFYVTNIGKKAGAEVAELYVADTHSTIEHPVKELKAFSRIELKPGETKLVTLFLNDRAFEHWNTNIHNWEFTPGEFSILVGGASDNLPLSQNITLHP